MNLSFPIKRALLAIASAASGHSLLAQNAWLPRPGDVTLTPSYTYQSYDTFRLGTAKTDLPADIVQQTETLNLDYGLAPQLALDASIGYTESRFKPPGARFTRNGRDDSKLGLRYQFVNETAELPAVAFRIGGIFAGNYDVPDSLPPINPGDRAGGVEASLAAGKTFGETGFGVYGDAGYRNRNHRVPDDFFGSAGLFKHFGATAVSIGVRHTQGLSGGDIGGPGFGITYGFPQVKETVSFLDGGITFTDHRGWSYQIIAARKFGRGRNTGDASVFGFSVGIPLKTTH